MQYTNNNVIYDYNGGVLTITGYNGPTNANIIIDPYSVLEQIGMGTPIDRIELSPNAFRNKGIDGEIHIINGPNLPPGVRWDFSLDHLEGNTIRALLIDELDAIGLIPMMPTPITPGDHIKGMKYHGENEPTLFILGQTKQGYDGFIQPLGDGYVLKGSFLNLDENPNARTDLLRNSVYSFPDGLYKTGTPPPGFTKKYPTQTVYLFTELGDVTPATPQSIYCPSIIKIPPAVAHLKAPLFQRSIIGMSLEIAGPFSLTIDDGTFANITVRSLGISQGTPNYMNKKKVILGDSAFKNCQIDQLNISDCLLKLSPRVFMDNKISYVSTLNILAENENLTIPESAFENNKITEAPYIEGFSEDGIPPYNPNILIGAKAFKGNAISSLPGIRYSYGPLTIGEEAFMNNQLGGDIEFESNNLTIQRSAFENNRIDNFRGKETVVVLEDAFKGNPGNPIVNNKVGIYYDTSDELATELPTSSWDIHPNSYLGFLQRIYMKTNKAPYRARFGDTLIGDGLTLPVEGWLHNNGFKALHTLTGVPIKKNI